MRIFKNTDEIHTERAANRNNPVIYSLLAVLLGKLLSGNWIKKKG